MANPSYGVNAFAKHIILNLSQNPTPVTWGRNKTIKNLVLSSPTVPPFTNGAKEYGLHYAADASPAKFSGSSSFSGLTSPCSYASVSTSALRRVHVEERRVLDLVRAQRVLVQRLLLLL